MKTETIFAIIIIIILILGIVYYFKSKNDNNGNNSQSTPTKMILKTTYVLQVNQPNTVKNQYLVLQENSSIAFTNDINQATIVSLESEDIGPSLSWKSYKIRKIKVNGKYVSNVAKVGGGGIDYPNGNMIFFTDDFRYKGEIDTSASLFLDDNNNLKLFIFPPYGDFFGAYGMNYNDGPGSYFFNDQEKDDNKLSIIAI